MSRGQAPKPPIDAALATPSLQGHLSIYLQGQLTTYLQGQLAIYLQRQLAVYYLQVLG